MRELRFWDTFNGVMTYSRDYKNVLDYFYYRQKVIDGGNGIEDMLSTELPDRNGKMIFENDILQIQTENNKSIRVVCEFGIVRRTLDTGWEVDIPSFYFKKDDDLKSFPIVMNWANKHDLEIIEIVGDKFSNPELLEGK